MMLDSGLLQSGVLEVCMLLCFAAAWPVSINKSWHARTAKGKSLAFMLILEVGYLFGIANKFVTDQVGYIVCFYVLNITLVSIDVMLWVRNHNYDVLREEGKTLD